MGPTRNQLGHVDLDRMGMPIPLLPLPFLLPLQGTKFVSDLERPGRNGRISPPPIKADQRRVGTSRWEGVTGKYRPLSIQKLSVVMGMAPFVHVGIAPILS